ncbi:hypothetical protein [Actinoplanes regularis]|uniref:hypothetical protein n=1 Tax=Actinoplanes regularis TaxID=52697 RepID=UPI0025534EA0|nr:hypothetical protein [Actinoplanes regularis]
MQSELNKPEVIKELDLWLEDDLTAEQLPTVVSASLLVPGCGGGCHGCWWPPFRLSWLWRLPVTVIAG